MTERMKELIVAGMLSAASGAGAGWATYEAKFAKVENALARLEEIAVSTNERVAEMYCAQVPASQRAGCR